VSLLVALVNSGALAARTYPCLENRRIRCQPRPRGDGSTPFHRALHRVTPPFSSPLAMFSPEASVQSVRSSLRNPRRRQRTSSGEPQAQPRRKRNKLTDELFVAKDEHVNGNGSALMNGHAEHSPESSLVLVDIPVREKKTPPKRPTKEDNGLYLVRPCQLSQTRRVLITYAK
jgi:hypothetical protein